MADIQGKTFPANCPHCGTKKVAFTVRDVICLGEEFDANFRIVSFDLFVQCGYCDRGIIATFHVGDGDHSLVQYIEEGGIPDSIAPTQPSLDAPPHTPDHAARFFKQGRDNMSGNWDAAGAMFRSALEAALKDKFPDPSGTLFSRIQQAAERHALTPELAEWSHQIRIEGNKAVHDEGPYQEEEARLLEAFTDMVFRYLFTLPGMLQERKRQLLPQQDDKQGSETS